MGFKFKSTLTTLLLIILVFSFQLINAQINTDLTLIKMKATEKNVELNKHKKEIKWNNPVKVLAYIPLFFYQKIISEQISATCEFDLSCSNFSIKAIKEFGIIYGICLTADRLTRCNGQAQIETEGYLINHQSGKVIDDPSMYSIRH